jgi:hypothetical protein
MAGMVDMASVLMRGMLMSGVFSGSGSLPPFSGGMAHHPGGRAGGGDVLAVPGVFMAGVPGSFVSSVTGMVVVRMRRIAFDRIFRRLLPVMPPVRAVLLGHDCLLRPKKAGLLSS